MTIIISNNSMIIIITMIDDLSWNDNYYTYILIITKQLAYDNGNSTKNVEFMHNRIMLSLKIILNQSTREDDMKDC
jgi:hypothetical protein